MLLWPASKIGKGNENKKKIKNGYDCVYDALGGGHIT
jgi:hypothetical protein